METGATLSSAPDGNGGIYHGLLVRRADFRCPRPSPHAHKPHWVEAAHAISYHVPAATFPSVSTVLMPATFSTPRIHAPLCV